MTISTASQRAVLPWGAAICLVLFLAGPAPISSAAAQQSADEDRLAELMEDANQMVGRAILSLRDKDSNDGAMATKQLQEIFRQVSAIFEKKKIAGGVRFAKNAQAGFKVAEGLARAGKNEEAVKVIQETRANCENCHSAHRERNPDGSYRIRN